MFIFEGYINDSYKMKEWMKILKEMEIALDENYSNKKL